MVRKIGTSKTALIILKTCISYFLLIRAKKMDLTTKFMIITEKCIKTNHSSIYRIMFCPPPAAPPWQIYAFFNSSRMILHTYRREDILTQWQSHNNWSILKLMQFKTLSTEERPLIIMTVTQQLMQLKSLSMAIRQQLMQFKFPISFKKFLKSFKKFPKSFQKV